MSLLKKINKLLTIKNIAFLTLSFMGAFLLINSKPMPSVNYFEMLKEGNQRYINNKSTYQAMTKEERIKLAKSQSPFASIVACSDSRVAPEIIFDQNTGELFVVRLAGNTVDSFAIGSIEFGTSYLKTPLLVILGHQNCGAVHAAFDLKNSSHNHELTSLLENIEPAVKKTIDENPGKSQKELLDIAIINNVKQTKNELLKSIPNIQNRIDEGKLTIKTGVFNIDTGEVVWFD